MKKRFIPLAAIPLAALATPAFAAITIDPSPPSGTFGNSTVTCTSGSTNCTFSDTTTFVTPIGFNQVGASLISGPALNSAQDIVFGPLLGLLSGVTLNGQLFTQVLNGTTDVATLAPIPLTPGATNTLVVSGTVGQSGSGSYAGTLNFSNVAAVPEPGTWLTMLAGLFGLGWVLRRKKTQTTAARYAMA